MGQGSSSRMISNPPAKINSQATFGNRDFLLKVAESVKAYTFKGSREEETKS